MTKVIIILGSPNDEQGRLSDIAASRCEQAVMVFNKNSDHKVLCTGGFGEHFNKTQLPHAHYVKNYLIKRGILEAAFLEFTLSGFTFEDASLSTSILEQNHIKDAILVTSDFHINRAKLIFTSIFPKINFTFSAAKTNCDNAEFQRLTAHEFKVIEREKLNLKKYLEHAL